MVQAAEILEYSKNRAEIRYMELKIKLADSELDHKNILLIRREVFIKEQQIPVEIEIDENEENSTYIIAYLNFKAVGTARWRQSVNGVKLERFAVLKKYRKKGIGAALTNFIIAHIPKEKTIYLNSQKPAIGFYERLGFVSVGSFFKEADIAHQKMVYQRKSFKIA